MSTTTSLEIPATNTTAAYPPPSSSAVPLLCPRCYSMETKFCYYNNYNLAQPRHFCRACRRYWTQGGALRDIPFDGGARKKPRLARHRSSASGSSSSPSSASTLTYVDQTQQHHQQQFQLLNLNDNVGMMLMTNSQQQPAGFLSLLVQQGYGCGGSIVDFGYDAPVSGFDLNTWQMSFADGGGLCDWPVVQNTNPVPDVGGPLKEEKMTADSSTSSCVDFLSCPDEQGGFDDMRSHLGDY